jgi:hypothetical protein
MHERGVHTGSIENASNKISIFWGLFSQFHEKLCIVKKRGWYIDRRGFHSLPAPPPIRYSMAGFPKGSLNSGY